MRIMLVDDQKDVLSGLKILLEQEPELCIIGEVMEVGNLLAQIQNLHPDLVLLDWELTGLNAPELISALRLLCPKVRIIALSGRPESRKKALDAGVEAFVSKGDQPEQLIKTIGDLGKVIEGKDKLS